MYHISVSCIGMVKLALCVYSVSRAVAVAVAADVAVAGGVAVAGDAGDVEAEEGDAGGVEAGAVAEEVPAVVVAEVAAEAPG
eukprot:g7669.t1